MAKQQMHAAGPRPMRSRPRYQQAVRHPPANGLVVLAGINVENVEPRYGPRRNPDQRPGELLPQTLKLGRIFSGRVEAAVRCRGFVLFAREARHAELQGFRKCMGWIGDHARLRLSVIGMPAVSSSALVSASASLF